MGDKKAIRRLWIEGDSGILKWEVEVLYWKEWEKVKLSGARVRPLAYQIERYLPS